MKSNCLLRRFVYTALLFLAATISAIAQTSSNKMVLVGGTDFEPVDSNYEKDYYHSNSMIKMKGLIGGSIELEGKAPNEIDYSLTKYFLKDSISVEYIVKDTSYIVWDYKTLPEETVLDTFYEEHDYIYDTIIVVRDTSYLEFTYTIIPADTVIDTLTRHEYITDAIVSSGDSIFYEYVYNITPADTIIDTLTNHKVITDTLTSVRDSVYFEYVYNITSADTIVDTLTRHEVITDTLTSVRDSVYLEYVYDITNTDSIIDTLTKHLSITDTLISTRDTIIVELAYNITPADTVVDTLKKHLSITDTLISKRDTVFIDLVYNITPADTIIDTLTKTQVVTDTIISVRDSIFYDYVYNITPEKTVIDTIIRNESFKEIVPIVRDTFYAVYKYKTLPEREVIDSFHIEKGTYTDSITTITPIYHYCYESNFHHKEFIAITRNPYVLDSMHYINDESNNWGVVCSRYNMYSNKILTYSIDGLKPNSPVKLVIKYRSIIDTTSNEYKSLDWEEPFTINITDNNASYTYTYYTSDTIMQGEKGVFINEKSIVPSNGLYQFNISMPSRYYSDCISLEITSIEVYGEIDPKISGVEELCVGGEIGIIYGEDFPGATYQWYKDSVLLTGQTDKDYAHTSNVTKPGTHEYYYELTIDDGNGNNVTFESQKWTVNDIVCCMNEDGMPISKKLIWQEDFGTSTSETDYWTWDYSDITNPKKVYHTDGENWQHKSDVDPIDAEYFAVLSNGACTDGEKFIEGRYTIASNVTAYGSYDGTRMGWAGYFGNGLGANENGLPFAPDHTYGTSTKEGYGGMLFLNLGCEKNSVIYSRTISGLCNKGEEITAQCFVNNFSAGNLPVNIFMRLTDPLTGLSVESDSVVRYANEKEGLDWKVAKANIELTGSELLLEIISKNGNAPGQSNFDFGSPNMDGNDLILDDIQLWVCSAPKINLSFDEKGISKNTIAYKSSDIKLYVNESPMIKNYYKGDARYLYQYTLNPSDNKSWKTIGDITKDTTCIAKVFEGKKAGDNVYFRVVLDSKDELDASLNYYYNNVCGTYSVSEPIVCTIKLPSCTPPADRIKLIASKDIVSKNNRNVVELCLNDSVVLSQSADITPKESTWNDNNFEGYSIKWFVDEKPNDMSDANTVFNDVVSPLTIEFNNSKLGGSETSVVLYAIDALYPDSECMTTDTVFIKFNEVPDATFRNPQAKFQESEGEGEVDLTLTKGTALDYTIHWWKGQDTLTGIFIGDDKSKKFFEGLTSENSGIYSYQLVDLATGCAGEVHNYEFIISRSTGVNSIYADDSDEIVNVFTMTGALIKVNVKKSEALNGLRPGTYLVGNEKVVIYK